MNFLSKDTVGTKTVHEFKETEKVQVTHTQQRLLRAKSGSGDLQATSCWRLEGYFGELSLWFLYPLALHYLSTFGYYRILARWTFDLIQCWRSYSLALGKTQLWESPYGRNFITGARRQMTGSVQCNRNEVKLSERKCTYSKQLFTAFYFILHWLFCVAISDTCLKNHTACLMSSHYW